jgi:hypothetical protein
MVAGSGELELPGLGRRARQLNVVPGRPLAPHAPPSLSSSPLVPASQGAKGAFYRR